jgi:hypothetical protein
VQDKAYLGNPPLSPVQYDAVRHIERIYYPACTPAGRGVRVRQKPGRLHIVQQRHLAGGKYWSEAPTNDQLRHPAVGQGIRQGPRLPDRQSMRVAYLLMCLESPQEYYGMPEQDTIHLLNVASSSGQAQQAFFMPIVRAVKKGWFADKCVPKQNVISYAKNIESISGHSDAESQEGLNLLLAIADEIDAFKSKKEMVTRKGASAREPTKSAEGILNMMRTSAPPGSPRSSRTCGSPTPATWAPPSSSSPTPPARLRGTRAGVPALRLRPLATWEVNPRVTGREAFAEDYREDPVMARAKYECRPAGPSTRTSATCRPSTPRSCHRPGSPGTVTYSLDLRPAATAASGCRSTTSRPAVPGTRGHLHHARRPGRHRRPGRDRHGPRRGLHRARGRRRGRGRRAHTIREVRPKVKVDFVISPSPPTSPPTRPGRSRSAGHGNCASS